MSRYPLPTFEHDWSMWNSADLDVARTHLDAAVTDDVEFCDPLDHHTGKEALWKNVRRFRRRFPDARFELRSGFDHHHDRYRYRWDMIDGDEVVVEGTDAVRVTEEGRIARVDGFFGPLPALDEEG